MPVSLAVSLLCTLAVLVLPTTGFVPERFWENRETWPDYVDYRSETSPMYSTENDDQQEYGNYNTHGGTGKYQASIRPPPHPSKTHATGLRQRNLLLDKLLSKSSNMKHRDKVEDYQLGLDVIPMHKKSPLSPEVLKDNLRNRERTSKTKAFRPPVVPMMRPNFNNASKMEPTQTNPRKSSPNDCMINVIYASSLTFLVTVAMVMLLYLVLVRMFRRRRFKPHDWWMAGQGSEKGDDDVMSLFKPLFHLAEEDEVFQIGGTPRSGTTSSSEEDSLMKSLNKKNKKMTRAQEKKGPCELHAQQNLRESRTERWVESVSQLTHDQGTQG
ncbi:uncharacterized protein LOC144922556 [Branchiostoma floridae x Branchiostoma belcheri]